MRISLNEKERQYFLNMLEEKFYTTENMEELQMITSLKQILQADTESWLSELSESAKYRVSQINYRKI